MSIICATDGTRQEANELLLGHHVLRYSCLLLCSLVQLTNSFGEQGRLDSGLRILQIEGNIRRWWWWCLWRSLLPLLSAAVVLPVAKWRGRDGERMMEELSGYTMEKDVCVKLHLGFICKWNSFRALRQSFFFQGCSFWSSLVSCSDGWSSCLVQFLSACVVRLLDQNWSEPKWMRLHRCMCTGAEMKWRVSAILFGQS